MKSIRVFSFGGGVQSVAVMVLQAQNKIKPFDAFVFANVGADSENPATLTYLEEYVRPYCERFGIPFVEVQKIRGGKPETLLNAIERDNKHIPIPVYMSGGAPGHRSCTLDYKVVVVDKWIKTQKITHATIGLGISTDESKRMKASKGPETHYYKNKPIGFEKWYEYPLIDVQYSRSACVHEIQAAGLPVPPKSSCFFCPFHSPNAWIELKREEPELFATSVAIETLVNKKRDSIGKDHVYLHRRAQPLEVAVADQLSLFESGCANECDSGFCHT